MLALIDKEALFITHQNRRRISRRRLRMHVAGEKASGRFRAGQHPVFRP